MNKQSPLFILASLMLAVSCGGGGGGGSEGGYDPKISHSPEVPSYPSGQTNWTNDSSVVNPNEVTVTNGPSITAKKDAAMGQFQNGSIIVAGGSNTSGAATKSVQLISSSNVVTSGNDLEEEVTGASHVMVTPFHVGMSNEFYVVGGSRLGNGSSNMVQKYSNNGTKTALPELSNGVSGGEMAYNSYAVSFIGGRWEAYDLGTVQSDGVNVMHFSNMGSWSLAPGDDLTRTPVYEITDHKLVNLNGSTYSVGGKYSGTDVYSVDYTGQTFTSVGTLETAVQAGHDAFAEANGSVITVMGGAVVGGNCTTAVQKFDRYNGTQETSHMEIGRCGHSSVELSNGDIIVVGGRRAYSDSSERTSSIERYDSATKTWKVVGKLTQARSGHKVFKRGSSQLVVVGGTDASGNPIAQTEIITY